MPECPARIFRAGSEKEAKKIKKRLPSIILSGILLIGFALVLYPSVSSSWNQYHSSKSIASYENTIQNMTDDESKEIFAAAEAYNQSMSEQSFHLKLSEEAREEYHSQLNLDGSGIMGYIEIPKIGVSLPIYHGTDKDILKTAVGHLEWSSLPVGGKGTHCVMSGHRGLASARLFTDLDNLVVGDTFVLRVLNQVLTYEVDQILVVDPKDVSCLVPEPKMDYCTLLTCTPYGVNSHRLLVRGHRIETVNESDVHIVSEVMQIEPNLVALVLAIPFVFALIIWAFIPRRKFTRGKGGK